MKQSKDRRAKTDGMKECNTDYKVGVSVQERRPKLTRVLYYYDRMFTLCYMLHLLFTGQDVHDLKLHVTEQKNVHIEPKFSGWSIRPLADWVCGSEVGWNRSRS